MLQQILEGDGIPPLNRAPAEAPVTQPPAEITPVDQLHQLVHARRVAACHSIKELHARIGEASRRLSELQQATITFTQAISTMVAELDSVQEELGDLDI